MDPDSDQRIDSDDLCVPPKPTHDDEWSILHELAKNPESHMTEYEPGRFYVDKLGSSPLRSRDTDA